MDEYRYLSEEKLTAAEKSRKKSMGWGIGLGVFFLMAVFGYMIDGEGAASTLVFSILGTAGGIFLFVRSLVTGRELQAARRYERLFSNDRDGVVTLAEMGRQTGKTPEAVTKELSALFQKNYFRDCVLEYGSEPRVVIADAMTDERGVGFVSVRCANCGAVTRMRAGSRGFCRYCGAPLSDGG